MDSEPDITLNRKSASGATNSRPTPDKIGSSSRKLLLDSAEQLFGKRGIDAASLREIAIEAGQRNNNAVAYHFGDKQGLVDALIADRLKTLEQMRKERLSNFDDLATCDAAALLHLMWQPLLDLDAKRPEHHFIQFMLAYRVENAGSGHPFITDPAGHPVSGSIMTALQALHPHIPREQFRYRLTLLAMMFWAAVAWHDHAASSANQRWSTRFSLDEVVQMTVAALSTPSSP